MQKEFPLNNRFTFYSEILRQFIVDTAKILKHHKYVQLILLALFHVFVDRKNIN